VDACEDIIDYRGRTPPISDVGVPHITSANIKNGRINWHTTKFVTEETYAAFMSRGIPRAQDVLFTMEAPLGEVGVVPDSRKFSLAQRVILLRPKASILLGDFLAKALSSPGVREKIHSKATATTVSGIASKRLKEIQIPIPPLPEQRRLVADLDALQAEVDILKHLQAETTIELDALLPSVLSKAFAGEL
jgi:type I restriction enzyme S subunit